MMISGDNSSRGGGAAHSTFRRIARVASSATLDCREVRIAGKTAAKSGKVWYSDAGTWAISINDAKEGLDWKVSRPQPRLLNASCGLFSFERRIRTNYHGAHKDKKHGVFSDFPVFANGKATTKTRKTCLEPSLRDGTSNYISARFQCGVQEGYQKGLTLSGFGHLGRTVVSDLTYLAGRELREIVFGFPLDPLSQFLDC
jgi:hypothetical protein